MENQDLAAIKDKAAGEVFQYVPLVGFECPTCGQKTGIDGRCGCYGVVSQTVRKCRVEESNLESSDVYARKMSNP